MALREKISSFAVGAASKANSLAVEAAAKANLAIENSKLNLKIGNEEKKIDTFTVSIGELILDKLDGGETFDDEIMALYSSIQASRETITNARAAIEANNRQAESAHLCAACGAPLAENAKYCGTCGAEVEQPEAETVEAQPAAPTCPHCGAEVTPEDAYCTQCGVNWEEEPAPEETPAEYSPLPSRKLGPAASGDAAGLFPRKEAPDGQNPQASAGPHPGPALPHLPGRP